MPTTVCEIFCFSKVSNEVNDLLDYENLPLLNGGFSAAIISVAICWAMSAFKGCVEDHCHARVGFMGNPSDGYKGKTLSFLLANFKATVRLEEKDGPGVEISEPVVFDNLDALCAHSQKIVSDSLT
jgi:hypothetical protein